MNAADPSPRLGARRWGGAALSVLGLLLIGFFTLRPIPLSLASAPAPCCSATDLVLNVLLFLPLGAGLTLLGLRPGPAFALGALASGTVELVQGGWVPGRFASLHDVASNAAGCLLGILLVVQWRRRSRWWPVLAPAIALTVVLAWFLGGYLAQPAIPGPSTWVVRVAHSPTGMAPFAGELLDARLQGEALHEGPVAGLPALRARLSASRKVELDATIVTGDAPAGRARILEVVVGEGTVPFLILDQEGGALLAFQRLGLSWVGLPGPWLTMADGISPTAGDTAHVRLEATRRHLRLVTVRGGVEREATIRLAPELYFGALSARVSDGAMRWILLPAMASFVLLGMSLANRPRLLVMAGLAALVLSAVGGGCALPAWGVALAACGGAGAGCWIGQRLGLFGA
jgi:VanZ family protein